MTDKTDVAQSQNSNTRTAPPKTKASMITSVETRKSVELRKRERARRRTFERRETDVPPSLPVPDVGILELTIKHGMSGVHSLAEFRKDECS